MTRTPVKNIDFRALVGRLGRYLQFLVLFALLSVGGILMGEQSLIQKQALEEKRLTLHSDNERVQGEIKALERKVTLLRSDSKTIERVAKRKLGMISPNETVYLFDRDGLVSRRGADPEHGLDKNDN